MPRKKVKREKVHVVHSDLRVLQGGLIAWVKDAPVPVLTEPCGLISDRKKAVCASHFRD